MQSMSFSEKSLKCKLELDFQVKFKQHCNDVIAWVEENDPFFLDNNGLKIAKGQ